MQKAFDTVDYNILFYKLSHYGIRDLANSWFSSCFSNRMQFISINGFDSDTQSPRYGVPQGSDLDPSVFEIHQWSSQCNKLFLTTSLCRWHLSVKHSKQNFQN